MPEPPASSSRGRGVGRVPGEPAADGAAHLELVARLGGPGQVGRDLAVVEALDGQLNHGELGAAVCWRPGDRVAALRGVAVGGGELDVDVLPGQVAGPAGDLEEQRAGGRGLVRWSP